MTGPKISKQLYRQAFRRDVRELVRGEDIKNLDLSQSNLLADEVIVDLNMLRATMMDEVGGHVDRTNVVAVDNRRRSKRDVELLK
jgi:hypothetical protein